LIKSSKDLDSRPVSNETSAKYFGLAVGP